MPIRHMTNSGKFLSASSWNEDFNVEEFYNAVIEAY